MSWGGPDTVWSLPVLLDATGSLAAISCPTEAFCMAVDTVGDAFTGDGTLSSIGPTASGIYPPTAVSGPYHVHGPIGVLQFPAEAQAINGTTPAVDLGARH